MELRELTNNIGKGLNDTFEKVQSFFLENSLGKTINKGFDLGIKLFAPDFIEDSLIDVKDSLIKGGIKSAFDTAVKNSIEIGKNTMNLLTGSFENIGQAKMAIEKGGLMDGISKTIDKVIKNTKDAGLIKPKTAKILKSGKNTIIDTIKDNVEKQFDGQINKLKNVEKSINEWKKHYEKKDFDSMKKEYNKMERNLKELMPLKNTLREAKKVENLHKLIENKGIDFNLSEDEINLALKLVG